MEDWMPCTGCSLCYREMCLLHQWQDWRTVGASLQAARSFVWSACCYCCQNFELFCFAYWHRQRTSLGRFLHRGLWYRCWMSLWCWLWAFVDLHGSCNPVLSSIFCRCSDWSASCRQGPWNYSSYFSAFVASVGPSLYRPGSKAAAAPCSLESSQVSTLASEVAPLSSICSVPVSTSKVTPSEFKHYPTECSEAYSSGTYCYLTSAPKNRTSSSLESCLNYSD